MDNNKEMIEGLVSQILDDYHDDKIINQQALFSQPDKEAVCDLLSKLIKIMYPGYFKGTINPNSKFVYELTILC